MERLWACAGVSIYESGEYDFAIELDKNDSSLQNNYRGVHKYTVHAQNTKGDIAAARRTMLRKAQI